MPQSAFYKKFKNNTNAVEGFSAVQLLMLSTAFLNIFITCKMHSNSLFSYLSHNMAMKVTKETVKLRALLSSINYISGTASQLCTCFSMESCYTSLSLGKKWYVGGKRNIWSYNSCEG